MSATPALGPYRIGERLGTSVWVAEDTRSGKNVALKLLSKQLPKDPARREAMVRDVRVTAALYHVFLVPIVEITPIGDNLVMIMDLIDAQSVARRFHGQPVDRAEFFRIAYQLVDVMKFLHLKGIRHANINADSVLISSDGHVRLGGLNMVNLMPRDGQSIVYQQKGNDARSVAYMSPELITGHEFDERGDIFSVGVVLYELATGKLPFTGSTPTDIARAIVEGQPASPKAIHPGIDPAVLSILGGCLYKDPYKRVKEAKVLLDAIVKLDAEAGTFAANLARRVTQPEAVVADDATRKAILLVADLANYAELEATDPERARRATARMQQILGESVFLFDGTIVDPFGARLVAELPSIESALEASRKGEFDFSPDQSGADLLQVRMLLTAGDVMTKDGVVVGAAITKAQEVLEQLPPLKLFISEDFTRLGRGNVRLRDAGARAGVKLYTIVDPEPKPVEDLGPEPTTADIEEELKEEAAALAVVQKAKRRKTLALAAVALGCIIAIGGGLGVMWMRRGPAEESVSLPASLPAATPAHPRKVWIDPIKVESADPALATQANAIRLGAVELLRTFPEIRVVDPQGTDVTRFPTKLRASATGPQIVGPHDIAVPAPDVASGIRSVVAWVTAEVKAPEHPPIVPAAMNAFADALLAQSINDPARTDASLRAALVADPNFLAAQMLAMRFYERSGKIPEALAAAKQITALDPTNLDASRTVAHANLAAGELQSAFVMYDRILKTEPNDPEALNLIARFAVGAGDKERFARVLERLKRVPPTSATAHEPDILVSAGRIEDAISRYYDIEVAVPNNPALSLKIGRISVLRRAPTIAELELKKLAETDPVWGLHVLKAYIAAQNGAKDEADRELQIAIAASTPGDDTWTSAAEVYAILADSARVITALEKAAQRKEPTASYVLANPLFRYLASDARFQKLQQTLMEQRQEMRAAVSQIAL